MQKAKVVGKVDLSNIPKTVSKINERIGYLLKNHWLDDETRSEYITKQGKVQGNVVQLQFVCSELETVISTLKKKYEPK